jgi:hypothetical protein
MTGQLSWCAKDDLLRFLRTEGILLNNDERFDSAKPLFACALRIAHSHYGPDHEETHDCLNNVALCDFNRGDYLGALASYEQLLSCVVRCYEADDRRYKITW